MSTLVNHRTYERIPIDRKVKVFSMGRMVAYTMAINIGMGGVLLRASSQLPVGSQCRVAIPVPDGEGTRPIEAEGTVVRTDGGVIAVQFLRTIERGSFDALSHQTLGATYGSILDGYKAYFRVSRNADLADCEKVLGVSKQTFKTSFYISFISCISLSILGVWIFRNSIPAYPNWVKVILSFVYGAIWLAVIQPAIDLTVFRVLRHRHAS